MHYHNNQPASQTSSDRPTDRPTHSRVDVLLQLSNIYLSIGASHFAYYTNPVMQIMNWAADPCAALPLHTW